MTFEIFIRRHDFRQDSSIPKPTDHISSTSTAFHMVSENGSGRFKKRQKQRAQTIQNIYKSHFDIWKCEPSNQGLKHFTHY
ncbi:MAG: hypothetical protein DWI24_05370 [Planctomycetota bacterium]|nr:MAG: hypothetical protein DWI24_05370 [Planctomycetota bacterium]